MLKMQIIGYLGRDAEVSIHGTESVINFSAAHSDKYKDSSGAVVNKTTWVSCSWWVERHTIAQYLKKGTQVWVEGIPEVKTWTDKSTGEKKFGLGLRVFKVELLGGRKEENNTASSGASQQPANQPTQTGYVPFAGNESNNPVDDLPF